MDERDKIIRDDYPVERLPEDLRAGLGDVARVRVTVEAGGAPREPQTDKQKAWAEISKLVEKARSAPGFRPVTAEEAVARIRALRDEWDR